MRRGAHSRTPNNKTLAQLSIVHSLVTRNLRIHKPNRIPSRFCQELPPYKTVRINSPRRGVHCGLIGFERVLPGVLLRFGHVSFVLNLLDELVMHMTAQNVAVRQEEASVDISLGVGMVVYRMLHSIDTWG